MGFRVSGVAAGAPYKNNRLRGGGNGAAQTFTRRLIVVSAATCWVLVVAYPTPASTLVLTADPTLTADPALAYPGDQIRIR